MNDEEDFQPDTLDEFHTFFECYDDEFQFDPNIFVFDEVNINQVELVDTNQSNQPEKVMNEYQCQNRPLQNVPRNIPANLPQQNPSQKFDQAPGLSALVTVKMCDRISTQLQLKQYLQLKISGNKNIRFNKKKLSCLFNIFVRNFGWEPMSREETRNKELVFQRLFSNKDVVVSTIEQFPSVLDQVLLCGGLK
ncbi:hypothetical protein M9Y10_043341 [Tritrichomonas musculus]|uniref:Initiator binding domain-containing protein n=1 Tax=Tritrichomonas musculus TaxID=1915356 RepID=A0ABR2K016_9EUKA